MLVDANEFPRERGTRASDLDALYATIYCSIPLLLIGQQPARVRVLHYAVSYVIGQGAVNNGSHSHRSAGKSTDVSRYEPLIVEITFQSLFQSTNVIAGGDQIAQEKYIRSMPQDQPDPVLGVTSWTTSDVQGDDVRRSNIQQ